MKPTRARRTAITRESPPSPDLRAVLEAVTQRAEQQGHILARQVREELSRAQADPRLWKEVLREAGQALERRGGHYYFVPAPSPQRQRQQQLQKRIRAVVQELVKAFGSVHNLADRREADRVTFLQPAVVHTPEGDHNVLTKDISSSGIRLLGSRDLLGQKVSVSIPVTGKPDFIFTVRFVWTCRVGDDLYENGGVLLDVVS